MLEAYGSNQFVVQPQGLFTTFCRGNGDVPDDDGVRCLVPVRAFSYHCFPHSIALVC